MSAIVCQVIIEALQVKDDLQELSKSMRRLRKAASACRRCPHQDCAALRELSSEITAALNELATEWSL
jgi:cell division protein ZapA (FtsZ GTPase activity inhibitor)